MQIRKVVVPAVIGLSVLAPAGAPAAPAHHSTTQSCGPAHRYIDAHSATVGTHRVLIYGNHSTLKCGGPDDSSYVDGTPVTLRMLKSGTVTVWKMPADPSQGTRTIAATDLPRWLKRNRSEPIYKISGPPESVTKLVEEWHP